MPERPPEEALHLVRAYARHAPIELVARLVTMTGETVLLDDAGRETARVSSTTTVSVYSGPRITQRFREIDLFSDSESAARADRDALPGRRSAARAPPSAGGPSARAGGHRRRRSSAPVTLGECRDGRRRRAPCAQHSRSSVCFATIPASGSGIDAEDVHQARVATRRLRSDLRTFQPLLDREWAERAAR